MNLKKNYFIFIRYLTLSFALKIELTSEALQAFIPKLLSKLYFEILVYGNATLKVSSLSF